MKAAIATQINVSRIEACLIRGDLSGLTEVERLNYFNQVCDSVGLNPLTKPFEYITLNGKLVLYATKNCAEQLRKIHGISVVITSREKTDDLYIVTSRASYPDGRTDESTGAVSLGSLRGEALANAIMKAETKSKRRVTLSIVGLGMLDETEVESITSAERTEQSNPIREAKAEIAAVKADPSQYVVPFGKFRNQKLSEITIHELESYVEYIQKKAIEEARPLQGKVLEFIEAAGAFVESRTPKGEPVDTHEDIPF